jgi:hypothetical protein
MLEIPTLFEGNLGRGGMSLCLSTGKELTYTIFTLLAKLGHLLKDNKSRHSHMIRVQIFDDGKQMFAFVCSCLNMHIESHIAAQLVYV